MANFVSYANAQSLFTAIGNKFAELNGAYVFKGSKTFAQLPAAGSITEDMTGYVYNMSEEFTTDSRFVEGSGKKYPAGTNVVVANVSSTTTADMKLDVIGSFVDVDAIMDAIADVADMIADDFDDATAYTTGDVVKYEDVLYKFTSDHAAGAWDSSDVAETTVADLIAALVTSLSTVNGRVDTVLSDIAPTFSSSTAYTAGDIVVYNDVLYKFTADHAAGAWSTSDTTAATVADLISAAEPDALTTEQVNALIALL